MELLRTIEKLISQTKIDGQANLIYGAGWAGKQVYRLLKEHGILITAFAVTRLEQEETVEDIPVYGLDDILNSGLTESKYNIILAVTETNKLSMEEELKKRNIHSYMVVSEPLLYEVTRKNRQSDAEAAEKMKKSKKNQITVGYLFPGYLDANYAEERLIIDKIDDITYIKMPKETAPIACIGTQYEEDIAAHKILTEACYCPDKYVPDVDLIHTFNMVCSTDKPWCASFETSMPRVWPKTKEEREYCQTLIDCMEKSNCKALYALSENAYKIQKHMMENYMTLSNADRIMKKTKILHPPQRILITPDEFEKKHDISKIHFIFIGRLFFIKGGREVIRVLSEFEGKYEFKLTLISSLLHNDYFTNTPYSEKEKYQKIVREKSWIDYYESLSNQQVLEKCKEATVGLLPSVAETYGYAVLEMQAAGCPVVTTNIRAFPEINNEKCGWIFNLPVNEQGICVENDSVKWSNILKQELRKCFQDIFCHPEEIKKKGKLAIKRIQEMHDPHKYQEELKKNLL